MLRQLIAVLVMFCTVTFPAWYYAPSICHAEISDNEWQKLLKEFEADTQTLLDYHQTTFLERHKWKIIGGGVGLLVAGVIIISTAGVGSGVGAAVGAGAAKSIAIAGGGVSALATGASLGASTGILADKLNKRGIKINLGMREKILLALNANREEIMKNSNNRKEAIGIMTTIAANIAMNYQK